MTLNDAIANIIKPFLSTNNTTILSYLTSSDGINHLYNIYLYNYISAYIDHSRALELSRLFLDFVLELEVWPITHGIPVLDIFYSIFAARNCRVATQNLNIDIVQLYVSYIVSTLGGSMMVAYLLGQPPGWLNLDLPFLVYTISFFLFQLPIISNILLYITSVQPIALIIQIFVDITWTTSITSYGFDAALRAPRNVKDSSIGPWIVGISSGLGGMICNQTFGLYKKNWSFQNPAILTNNIIFRMVVFATSIYYIMINPHELLPTKFTRYQARAAVLFIILLGDTFLSNAFALMSFIRGRKSKAIDNDAANENKVTKKQN